jgi:hypothetical protein
MEAEAMAGKYFSLDTNMHIVTMAIDWNSKYSPPVGWLAASFMSNINPLHTAASADGSIDLRCTRLCNSRHFKRSSVSVAVERSLMHMHSVNFERLREGHGLNKKKATLPVSAGRCGKFIRHVAARSGRAVV